jgi:hypothetical protein
MGSVPIEKLVIWTESPVVGFWPKLGIFGRLICLNLVAFLLTVLFIHEKINCGCSLSAAALVFCAVYYLLLKFGILVGLASIFVSMLCGSILSLLGYLIRRYVSRKFF